MITKVEVFSAQPGAPELSLGGFYANLDPVQLRDIQGLGPVKADIQTEPFATGDGELYKGSTVGKRNIVMAMGLNPDWATQTVASLRQLLYRYFLPKAWCKLRFTSDHMPVVDIEGYVESFDENMFSQDPEMQVSIICPKPDFIEADATIYYGVVDDGTAELEFEYTGTVETGFELRIDHSVENATYTGPIEVRAKQEPSDWETFKVNGVTVNGTKYFKLSSVKKAKRVQSISHADGAQTNLLASMTDESVWPVFKPGTNVFSVKADETGQAWTMAYFNRYGGL